MNAMNRLFSITAWGTGFALVAFVAACSPKAAAQAECYAESKVLVVKVTFTDTNLLPGPQDKLATRIAHRCYDSADTQEELTRLLDGLHGSGYLRAEVGKPAVEVVDESSHPKQIALTFSVAEGVQYFVGAIDWQGVTNIAPTQIEQMIDMHPGEPFDSNKAEAAAKRIRSLYTTNGYKKTQVTFETSLNDEEHTVALNFKVEEGRK